MTFHDGLLIFLASGGMLLGIFAAVFVFMLVMPFAFHFLDWWKTRVDTWLTKEKR